ncbi:MAG: MlaD family protein [Photobacterium frigidiphilum]|uniref:PqiB family protein n=1 Tax=Photobacterium frigidiphilum TaxID=264736 RepID=UPI0030039D59
MNNGQNDQQPEAVDIRRDRGLSPLWLLPLLALVLAGWLVFKAVNESGERIQIHFNDAAGLIAGRTTIRYQGLEVGIVRDVNLSEDLQSIYVDADIYPKAVQTLKANTRFWLVKPKASITGISGLDALVSGNYIALQPGEGKTTKKFTALDTQPADTPLGEGLTLQLRSPDLASVSIGSQVFYKKIPVGEVYNYTLSQNRKQVLIDVTIKPQYSELITNKSRFWNVSGMSANIGFNGVDVQFESLSAMIGGAIAFDSPDEGVAIEPNHLFRLYPDLNTAGRGIAIKVELPDGNNISTSGAPIIYRGLEIGQISSLRLDKETNKIIANAAIEPSMSDLLNTGSRLLLEEAEVSLNGVKNIGNLIRGNFLTLIPGEGEKARMFQAITQDQLQEQQPGTVSFALYANNSYGIERGSKLRHRGLDVGRVKKVSFEGSKVRFDVIVRPQYTSLVRSNSRFFIDGGIQASISAKGIDVSMPPADQLISNGISFTSSGSKSIQNNYPLYENKRLSNLAADNQRGFAKYSLFADELPPVSEGSPILYRNLQVGEVTGYALVRDGVTVSFKIENKYRHLISPSTVFWNRSGVEIEAGFDGIKVKADPISTLIKGGIAFDDIVGVTNKAGSKFKLYPSLSDAQNFGLLVTLTAPDARSVSKNADIRYQGVNVGKVVSIEPNFNAGNVQIKARLFPKYANILAKSDSYFWTVTPKLSLSGAKNLDSLLNSYIAVQPGDGAYSQTFKLGTAELISSGLTLILESEDRGSVSEGTPLLYRDIQVGQVIEVALGDLSDRVLIKIQIEKEYSHLIRTDTVFWNASGVDFTIGLTGAKIQTGTVDSLLRGGISFATPEEQPLSPLAKQEEHFLLHKEADDKWKTWRTAIPRD